MNTLSNSTLAILIEVGGDRSGPSKDDLKTLLLRVDLANYGDEDATKNAILRRALLPARQRAENGDPKAHRSMLTFMVRFLEMKRPDPTHPPGWFRALTEALLADGYQLTWHRNPDADPFAPATFLFQILPTDATPVPLAPELSALEADLAGRGYDVPLSNYRQAVDNFVHHNYEAANGALRTTLEALVMQLAKDHASYVGHGKAGEGKAAIDHLVSSQSLPADAGGDLLQGLWKMTHTNGPHPGQSNADEARFRLHVVTATARHLLNHFPAKP
jgi:hypothetical protein